jgi:hypothetical protein
MSLTTRLVFMNNATVLAVLNRIGALVQLK